MKHLLTGLFCLFFLSIACAETKNISLGFDIARLTMQKKDNAILFNYNDVDCQYVEYGPGTPVLPCKHVYIVMPKNAKYSGCRVSVTKERLKGSFSLYTRTKNKDVMRSARAYPSKLVEFVKQYDMNGYRIFKFRTYPVSCQPADGSVVRTIRLNMQVKYEAPNGAGAYPARSTHEIAKLKRLVINPDDFDRLTQSSQVNPLDQIVSAPRNPEYLAREVFATKLGGSQKKESNRVPKEEPKRPSFRVFGDSSDPIELIKNNFTVSDGGLMFTPFQF